MAGKTFPLTVIAKVADDLAEHAPSQARRLRQAIKEMEKLADDIAASGLNGFARRLRGLSTRLTPAKKRKRRAKVVDPEEVSPISRQMRQLEEGK